MKTVKCPKPFEPLFEKAEEYVSNSFEKKKFQPEKGTITINGERYILVRAQAMSVHFMEFIKNMYPVMDEEESISAASKVLFDIAHSIGRADAVSFHKSKNITDPVEKLSTGPVHFAHTGWAYVDISEESQPISDENYYLLYDHPYSFEADSWIKTKNKTNFCTCFMNSGYSSGWCSESFSVDLVAREILCRAKGDDTCRFIMAHSDRIDARIEEYRKNHPELFENK